MVGMPYLTTFLLALALTLISYLIWMFHNIYQYWKRKNVPFLIPYMPFGNTLDLFLGKITIGELFSNAYLEFKRKGKKHGGIYYINNPIYIPVDPDIIKKILITNAEYFPNHGLYINTRDDILSGHLFNMEDAEWRNLRAKTPSIFTSSKMKSMFVMMNQMLDPFKMWLDQYSKTQEAVEIKSLLSRFTTDIFCACAFGIETNTLKNRNNTLLHHGRKFFDYQWNLFRTTLVVILSRDTLKSVKFRVFTKSTEKFVLDMFSNIYKYRKENKVFRNDLTDTLMRLTEKNANEKDFTGTKIMDPLTMEEFSTQMFMFYNAGFETSSSTKSFALYELAKNQDCQSKLRREIYKVLSKYENKLTYEALMDMKYLDQCVNETLRMYPIFPLLPRVCGKDFHVPNTNVTIEKGTFVAISNMGIQRDPEYYPNPLQFDPERWTFENSLNRPFVANLPFGEGPRICVGKRFGLLLTKLGLVTIIQDYEISLNDKTSTGCQFASSDLILRKKGDIWLNIKKITNR